MTTVKPELIPHTLTAHMRTMTRVSTPQTTLTIHKVAKAPSSEQSAPRERLIYGVHPYLSTTSSPYLSNSKYWACLAVIVAPFRLIWPSGGFEM